MASQRYADAALVLMGHGTTLNPDSATPVYQHAAELNRRHLFSDVYEAFWKQPPQILDVLESISVPRIFIVPLFVSEGYFSEEVIPAKLGFRAEGQTDFPRVLKRADQTLYYCKPIGTHDSMTNVILARAREVTEKFPFPRAPKPRDTALFIAGHGTDRSESSRKSIERQMELIRAMDIYESVHAIFMEEEPRITDCFDLSTARNFIVVPFFISDGLHTREDIPVMLGEPARIVKERLASGQPTWRNPTEKNGKLIWYTPAIGGEPLIADVILERVNEAATWK